MGKIRINNLKYYTRNGVFAQEKELGQQLEIDVELTLDLEAAGQSDDVHQTVSYADINDLIADHVNNQQYDLIEGLCYGLLDAIEADYQDRIDHVRLRIRKYSVPMPGIFDNIEIEMDRDLR